MADSPLINVDLSKAFHPRCLELLTPLLPGLFGGGCVLVVSPDLVWDVLGRTRLDRCGVLVLAVLAAFVVGECADDVGEYYWNAAESRFVQSPLLMMAVAAVGWGGLVARHFVPGLGGLYTLLCAFLVMYGLFNSSSSNAWHEAHPVHSWAMGLSNAMEELKSSDRVRVVVAARDRILAAGYTCQGH